MNQLSDIEKYTVGIYSEKNQELKLYGSGILVQYKETFLLLSAHHVFDREDEQFDIENDPDENGIPQDNMESFFAKGKDGSFFYVNDFYQGLVFTTKFNSKKNDIEFNEDTEFGICKLDQQMVKSFIESGKRFYQLFENNIPRLKSGENVILGGFPKYAQIGNEEIFRSYIGQIPLSSIRSERGLTKILFDNDHAFCIEKNDFIKIKKPEGIAGMSGGGVWIENNGDYIPLGLILRQEKGLIEIYPFSSILAQNIFQGDTVL